MSVAEYYISVSSSGFWAQTQLLWYCTCTSWGGGGRGRDSKEEGGAQEISRCVCTSWNCGVKSTVNFPWGDDNHFLFSFAHYFFISLPLPFSLSFFPALNRFYLHTFSIFFLPSSLLPFHSFFIPFPHYRMFPPPFPLPPSPPPPCPSSFLAQIPSLKV